MERSSGVVWQPQELARAIVLLCHFHSLAIFCLGTGAKLEIDHQIVELLSEAKKSAPPTPVATPSTTFGEGEQNKKDEEVSQRDARYFGVSFCIHDASKPATVMYSIHASEKNKNFHIQLT